MSSITASNFEARLDVLLRDVNFEPNQDKILDFVHERQANGIQRSTLISNASGLRDFSNFLGKPFIEADRRDFNTFVNKREGRRLYRSYSKDGTVTETVRATHISDATMDIRKIMLRVFYRWLHGTEEYPECVKHLKTNSGTKNTLQADRLVTREELQQLIQAAGEHRLRALVAVMWETGLRAGEVVALNVESVEIDQMGAKITIPRKAPGLKTGSRTVRVLPNESAPHLQAWLEIHPFKHDPTAPLFHGASRRNPFGRLLPSSLYAVIKSLTKRAGINRHIKPHDFRHTAATEKARLGYNESSLRWYFGWSRTSPMPTTYVHLAGADFEEMMYEKHGIEVPAARPRAVMFAPCPTCDHTNDTGNKFCGNCRKPLTPDAEADEIESQNEALMQMVKVLVEERVKEVRNGL